VEKIGVVIIGYGYWGPNLARNIALNPHFNLLAIVDQDEERQEKAKETFGVKVFGSHLELDLEMTINLVIICTRPGSHRVLATYFIDLGCHILITKPCGLSSQDSNDIAIAAERNAVRVFSDFTYFYSPLVKFLQENPLAQEIVKEMHEFTSYRTSLGIIQADTDVLADLAVHDLNILQLLKGSPPLEVSCLRTNHPARGNLSSAILRLTWEDGFTASIHVSWNSPKKVRFMSLIGKNKAILIEEMNRETPIQIVHFKPEGESYEHLTNSEKITRNVSYVMGEVIAPKVEMYEALAKEVDVIGRILSSNDQRDPVSTIADAYSVWVVIEALRISDQLRGEPQYVR